MGTDSEAAVGAVADSCDDELFSSPTPYWWWSGRSSGGDLGGAAPTLALRHCNISSFLVTVPPLFFLASAITTSPRNVLRWGTEGGWVAVWDQHGYTSG
jgi:hypothetical protein